jgi:hypothetical protein
MNPAGRTFSFDQDASGWIRAEGSTSVVLKRTGEKVDGEWVDDGWPGKTYGFVVGWQVTQSGQRVSLHAPASVPQQMGILDACRQANISPLDIDCVAAHGEGRVLHDAVEIHALAKILRDPKYGSQMWGEEVLQITNSKCRQGAAKEADGLTAFMMQLMLQRACCAAANLHLKVLNPHIADSEAALNISTEACPMRMRTTFSGISAQGFGGTNAHNQLKVDVDEDRFRPPQLFLQRNFFSFWPGGGGQIQYNAAPVRNYTILGSWSAWQDLEPMEDEGGGIYSYTVALGENRFEQFQILLDGDRSRTLHPGQPGAACGTAAYGPDVWSMVESSNWLLEGRPVFGSDQVEDGACDDALALRAGGSPSTGVPGDVYKIQLQVAGKWRAVVWSKVTDESGAALRRPVPQGSYYIMASWDDWSLQEMDIVDTDQGSCSLEVCVSGTADRRFQLIRNKDPSQVFYPEYEGDNEAPVRGPDDNHEGRCWVLP